MQIHSDFDAPIFALNPVKQQVSKLRVWRRSCSSCGWYLDIADFLQPSLKHIQCPKCGATTNLIER